MPHGVGDSRDLREVLESEKRASSDIAFHEEDM